MFRLHLCQPLTWASSVACSCLLVLPESRYLSPLQWGSCGTSTNAYRVLQQRWQLPRSCSSLPGSPGKVLVLSACPEATPCPWGWCHPSAGLSPVTQASAQGRALYPSCTLTSPSLKGNMLRCTHVKKKKKKFPQASWTSQVQEEHFGEVKRMGVLAGEPSP